MNNNEPLKDDSMTQDSSQVMTARQKAEQIRLRLLCKLEEAMDAEDPIVRAATLRRIEDHTQYLNNIFPRDCGAGEYDEEDMSTEETPDAPEYTTTTKLILGGIVALFVLACVTMLSGCYAPDLSKVKYRCDVAALCPDGLACVQGWCVDPAVQMGADAGVMTQADMMAVSMPPSCARGVETVLSSRMHGCYGTVAAGEFNDSLCKSGRLCTQNDPAAMDPPMFYLANVLGQQTAPAPVSGQIVAGWGHGAQYNQTTRYLFGRGGGNYVERSPVSVSGFSLVMQCLPTGTSYASCPWNWGDDRDVNRVTATGWLCCNF